MARKGEHSRICKAGLAASLLIFIMLIPATGVAAQDRDWLMYRYDIERRGNSPLTSNIIEPEIKWTFLTGDDVKSPPTVGDINNDGEFEVVFGSNDQHLYALDMYGNELWNFSVIGDIVCSPTIGDVDGDSLNEIVFGGYYQDSGDPYMYVLNGEDGSLLWQFETESSSSPHRGFQASALLHDINGDGINDILVGSLDFHFYAFNGPNGDVIWRSEIFEHFIRASSPIGDIDLDGDLEVVVVDNHAIVRVYNAVTGFLEWENTIGYGVEATPVIADVDGDGYGEIILFTIGRKGLGISGDAVVLNHDGTELWRSSVHTYFYTSPTVLDIDGDGLVDIIGGDSNDHTIIAYKGTDGTILWETVLPDSIWSQAPLVTADIDSDGVIEVIAGAYPNLYCLSTVDGSIEWIFETTEHIWGQPTIADLEQDGLAEILFGCNDDYLYVLENAYEPPVADAGEDQTIDEGDAVFFNGTGSYDPNYDWHKLDVNYASDAALYLRTLWPIGPGAGGWEGGVMEWVTFSSSSPFWIAKKEGHLGQGPTGKEYNYFFKMHETGNFTLHFRSGNGHFYTDVYDVTDGTILVSGLFVDHGVAEVVRHLNEGHVYRLYIYNTLVTNPAFPNDLDVIFEIKETDILLTPDLDSLVYYVSQNPLDLAIEGPGVNDITIYSRNVQEFYAYYAFQLDHSNDVVSGGELGYSWPPHTPTTGITPGEYNDITLPLSDEMNYSWDFDSNVDSDGDGDPTNDVDATGPTPIHVYGDDGVFTVTLTVLSIASKMKGEDTCNVTVLNVEPSVSLEVDLTMDVEVRLRVAGSKWSNVGMTVYEDDNPIGYLEVERWPGNPDDNPSYMGPALPTTLDLSKNYTAIVTYDPYPDNGDEIMGDQPNNGKDKKDNAGNPVWIILSFENGSEERMHHTFNTQQSMIRDSEHWNHVEPWEVELKGYLKGHNFELTTHITDPGSDDEILTYDYGTQSGAITYLNNPPNPDPYPSPEVNPVNIDDSLELAYEGPGILTLTVEDDDGGLGIATMEIG